MMGSSEARLMLDQILSSPRGAAKEQEPNASTGLSMVTALELAQQIFFFTW